MSSTITSLTEFFQRSGYRFMVFDMGRRIVPFAAEAFHAIEQGDSPYPYPLQRQAWLGLLGWPEDDRSQHFIWFLRLPLEETGNIAYAARDDLLRRLIEMAAQGLQGGAEGAALQASMEDNPYGYKPSEERMAVFHAKARKALELPPSPYYAQAHDYFAGRLPLEQWQGLGLQGIADLCARLEEEQNALHLAERFKQLPDSPFEALCKCLENEALDLNLAQAIAGRVQQELTAVSPNAGNIALCLRALALAQAQGMRRNLLEQLLSSPLASDIQVLVAIAGRCWQDLEDVGILHDFLNALAVNPGGQEVFNTLLGDLFTIPGMRVGIMTAIRDPHRSEALASCLGQFFSAIRQ